MIRKIDQLGRLVIPVEYRQAINVGNNEEVNIELQGKKIIVTKSKNNQLTAEDIIQEAIECVNNNLENYKGKRTYPKLEYELLEILKKYNK